jgi:hypothetical protein
MIRSYLTLSALIVSVSMAGVTAQPDDTNAALSQSRDDAQNTDSPLAEIQRGRSTFRFDTFGDEAFWVARCICTKPSPARIMAASDRV